VTPQCHASKRIKATKVDADEATKVDADDALFYRGQKCCSREESDGQLLSGDMDQFLGYGNE